MKKSIFIIALFSIFTISSQNLNYQNELERMVKVPNTPEAEAFAKYGNTSVSMYSGTPNISVPIYTISGRELDLPISLTYDASGVKVAQLASQAGLGWNLNVGGRISRTINGLADDYFYIAPSSSTYTSIYSNDLVYVGGSATNRTLRQLVADNLNPPQEFDTQTEAENYFKFLKEVSDNKLDTQPDYFSFNALGNSDHFVFDLDSVSFKSLDNPRTKIAVTFDNNNKYIISWVVTTENGTKYYFDEVDAEETHMENLNDINGASTVFHNYYSSWLLSKIESPNLKDTYEFTYSDLGLSNTQPDVLTIAITNEMNDINPESTGSTTLQSTTYKVSQLALTEIKHNGKVVVDLGLKMRYDLILPSGLSKIDIYEYDETSILKSFEFNHSYFGLASGEIPNPKFHDPFDIRLKLDSISIKSANNTVLSSYGFEYFLPEDIPPRDSYKKDYLGLYNGKYNTVLYPAVAVSGTNFSGADRSPDFSKAIIGTLKTLTYPTGGYTEFTYEANKTTYTTSDVTETTQDVIYGSLSVAGGIGDIADCGNCCIDQYGNPPNNDKILFNIYEDGSYLISYDNTNGGDSEAYLFLRSSNINATPSLEYDEVIDQSNCAVLVPMIWTNFSGYNDDSVYLTRGTYQITLVKGYFVGGSGTISLGVHGEETTSPTTVIGTGEVARAGLRVKTIKDYSDTNELSSEKEYQYTTDVNGSDSSGEIVFDPTFYTFSNYQVYITNPDSNKGQVAGLNTLTRMTRVNSWSGGDRPHIAYIKVYEIQKGLNSDDNGYIEHKFNVGWYNGVFSTGITPGANLYSNDFKIGKEKQANIYSTDNELLNTDNTTYNNPQYFGNSTLYIHNNINNSYSYVDIYSVVISPVDSIYRYRYAPAVFTGFSGPTAPGTAINAVPPQSCEYCLQSLDYSSLETRQTYAQGKIGGVLTKENIMYYNGVSSIQSSNNTYDENIDYLLRETQTVNSEGDTLKTKNYYTKDFDAIPPYNTLVTQNRLTEVIQTKSFKNDTLLFTRKNTYKDTGAGIFPNIVLTAKAADALETRIKYEYEDGNITDASQHAGDSTETHISYIWGYEKSLPIAKIENLKYTDILSNTITTLQTYSNSDIDETTELTLRTGLNNLRTQFPDAQITTYTYDPSIGVTSITDPRGQVIYFYYDEFNRLEYVTDADGKVLSKNQYNYRTN